MQGERKTVGQLFPPICLEIFCFMLAGMVDTLMLSTVGDDAVGAIGTANTYLSMFIIMFTIISSGMIAVVTQYIGAGKIGVARQAKKIGAIFNGTFGVLLSLFMLFGAEFMLGLVGVAPALMGYAKTYIQIVGGTCFLNSLTPIYSSYLRAFGHTKEPMQATIAANIVNLVLNAIFLFGFKMGVAGVAIATVISKVVNLAAVLWVSRKIETPIEDNEKVRSMTLLGQIVKIGFPSAMETALYNFAMTLIIRFLNQMDAEGLNVTARSYANLIANFSYCVAAALAQANAIVTGWRIGAGEFEECYKGTKRVTAAGTLTAVTVSGLIAIFAKPIVGLFSDNPEIISLVAKLMVIDIVLEIGRVSNIIIGQALKTSGDALFTTMIACIFMFICAVGGTYFFGLRLEMMVVGAYIAMAADECVRAVCMFLRWKSGAWKSKALVHK